MPLCSPAIWLLPGTLWMTSGVMIDRKVSMSPVLNAS